MPEYADLYVLSLGRNEEAIRCFLNEFLPERQESADEYELPQFSDNPHSLFKCADKVITHCCRQQEEPYAIYWRSANASKPEHAMVFFLSDGHMIFGLSTDAADEKFTHALLERLKTYFRTQNALLFYEQMPPETAKDFIHEMKQLNEGSVTER